jgi:flagellar hook assembly protein FlgD
MAYMRMQESKFWGWVITSLVIGLALGLVGMYFFSQYATAKKIDAARTELSGQIADATTKSSALEKRLASSEASLAALTEANAQLTAELETAKAGTQKSTTASSTLSVVSREVQPDSVTASGTITMTAKVKGAPDKVTMRVTAKSGGFDQTYSLKKVSTSGTTETWRASFKAPSKKGDYRYYATAISGDTKVTMTGASPSTLTVH